MAIEFKDEKVIITTVLNDKTWDGVYAALSSGARVTIKKYVKGELILARMYNQGPNQYGTAIPRVYRQIGQISTSDQVWGYSGIRRHIAHMFHDGDEVIISVVGGKIDNYIGWRDTHLKGIRMRDFMDVRM